MKIHMQCITYKPVLYATEIIVYAFSILLHCNCCIMMYQNQSQIMWKNKGFYRLSFIN